MHVPHKLGSILVKRRSAEDVIRMNVRHDHVFDRQPCDLSNRGSQTLAIDQTPSWIHDCNGVSTDNEPDVGDSMLILRGRVLINTASNVNSWRDLIRNKRMRIFRRRPRASPDATKARAGDESLATRDWRWIAHVSTIRPIALP
jgi:hypothetical protein